MSTGEVPMYSPLDKKLLEAVVSDVATELERRSGEAGRRQSDSAVRSEWARWGISLILACVGAYFVTIATMDKAITEVKTTEEAHFQEVLRRFDVLQADIREMRK